MSNEFQGLPEGKRGRYIGALVGLAVGIIILFPKVILLLLLLVVGYFVGGFFDRRGGD